MYIGTHINSYNCSLTEYKFPFINYSIFFSNFWKAFNCIYNLSLPKMTVKENTLSPKLEWSAQSRDGGKEKLISRDLKTHELLFESSGDTWPVRFAITVDLSSSKLSEESFVNRLRQAWVWLAYEYPTTTTVVEKNRFIARIFSTLSESDKWAESTFKTDTAVESIEDLPALKSPPECATLYFVTKTSQVVLVSRHSSIEASGAMKVFDLLLNRAVNIEKNEANLQSKTENLPLSLETALDLHEVREEHQKAAGEALKEYTTAQPSIIDSIVPAQNEEIEKYGDLGQTALTFSEEETAKIIQKAKETGYSVTTYVYAALLSYLKSLECNNSASYYSSFAIYNLRTVLPEETAEIPFAFYGGFWPIVFETSKISSSKELLDAVQDYLKNAIDTLRNNAHSSLSESRKALKPMAESCLKLFQHVKEMPEGVIKPAPNISSFGVCENQLSRSYGDVIVSDFDVGTITSSPQIPMFAYSFRDTLRMSSSYNRGFHSDKQMKERNDSIKQHMMQLL